MSKKIQPILLTINLTLTILWIYQGLIPKVLYKSADELRIWQLQGIDEITALTLMHFSGYIEIIFGLFFIIFRYSRVLHVLNIIGMIGLSALIIILDGSYFKHAFNPFVMNVAMAMLSVVAIQLLNIENKK